MDNSIILKNNILAIKTIINTNGIYIELTDKNGNTFNISEIPDKYLISALKSKGYEISKKF